MKLIKTGLVRLSTVPSITDSRLVKIKLKFMELDVKIFWLYAPFPSGELVER